MSNKFTFFSAAALLLAFTSCHKNNDTPAGDSGPLEGNYQFLYIIGDTKVTATGSSFGVTGQQISTCQFKTGENTGTVTFTADSLIGKNLGYSVNTPVTTVRYANGIVIDTTIKPNIFTVPSGSSATKYQIFGKDSIYCPGGALGFGLVTTGGAAVVPPVGGHFVIKGDTLTITTKLSQSYPDVVQNIPVTVVEGGNATIYLVKK